MLKKTSRKKYESSPLVMYLLLRTSSGKFINWTQAGVQQIDTEQKFKGLDEIDLMEMIYDLKKANLDEDKAYLEAVRLTNNPAVDLWSPWSPDGKKIVFESGREGNREIFVMNTDGTNQTRLTRNTGSNPAGSPDGKKIAFTRGGEIYVMNADGSNPVNLTNLNNLGVLRVSRFARTKKSAV